MKQVQRQLCWIALFAATLFILPASAAAECASDADCDDGFTRETVPEPCPAMDCREGEDCTSECESETSTECVPEPPASCTKASDCSSDEVCVTYTFEECSGGDTVACAPEQECDAGSAPDVSCTTQTEGYCLPPYLAPCEADADCGAGFECVQSEICQCSGGGSSGGGGSVGVGTDEGGSSDGDSTGSGDSADAGSTSSDDENCSCSPTGDYYCKLLEQECSADSECPGDMVCAEPPNAGVSDGTVCTSTPDGGTDCGSADDDSSSDPTTYCLPPDFERWAAAGGSSGGGTSQPVYGGSQNDSEDGGREVLDKSVDRTSGGSSSGSGGSSDSAGCSSAPGSGPLGGGLASVVLVLLGLFGLRRSRFPDELE